MKATKAGFLLGIGFCLCVARGTLAQPADQHTTVLHLSQTAETDVVRDLLRIDLRVEETGTDPLAVQTDINRRMTAALDRAHQVQGVQVETGSYSVGEERPQNGPSRWRGTQSLILRSKAADAALKLAGALQSDGLLMSSMVYEASPEALAALDRRAASIADRMHLAVLRYRDLHVGNAATEGRPIPRFAAAAMAAPVAEPGEATIRLTVEAELVLGAPHP